jgi:NADPH-dependent 2,4-dienoyl-CoA reductase/sulfur reductase-like enzyme
MARQRVLIVGASLAGVSAAERIRQRGDDVEIVVIGDEAEWPYDRPPLSKQVLTGTGRVQLLHEPSWYAAHDIQLRRATRAVSLEPDRTAVALSDGETLAADAILIATGARARRVPAWAGRRGVHYLRSAADSRALGLALNNVGSLIVVGCGFVGLEVAAAASRRGWRVTVVESAAAPLQRVLPAELAVACVAGYLEAGVNIRTGATVTELVGTLTVRAARLSSGELLEADLVVVGVGAVPNTEWLAGAGLDVGDGVRCGADGRTNRPGIWAAGDVAAWHNTLTGTSGRVEQWQAARDHGARVADAILGDQARWDTPPYFWSDLLDAKLQFSGCFTSGMRTHTARSGRKLVAVVGERELCGVVTLGSPKWQGLGQRHLLARTNFDEACSWADQCVARAA